MRSEDETNDKVEGRLQSYKALRAKLNLPPLADDQQTRQLIFSREERRNADEACHQEQEQERQRRHEAWQYQMLATHQDVKVVRRKSEVFTQTTDGEEAPLPPPHVAFELNKLNADLDLNTVSEPVVVDEKGYAWTQHPEIAFFSDDGSRLTVHWITCAHEQKYGWEYSHAIVQRVTWGRTEVEGKVLWCWLETIERGELSWASSTEQWTSLCRQ